MLGYSHVPRPADHPRGPSAARHRRNPRPSGAVVDGRGDDEGGGRAFEVGRVRPGAIRWTCGWAGGGDQPLETSAIASKGQDRPVRGFLRAGRCSQLRRSPPGRAATGKASFAGPGFVLQVQRTGGGEGCRRAESPQADPRCVVRPRPSLTPACLEGPGRRRQAVVNGPLGERLLGRQPIVLSPSPRSSTPRRPCAGQLAVVRCPRSADHPRSRRHW